jgi:hypothetical protein
MERAFRASIWLLVIMPLMVSTVAYTAEIEGEANAIDGDSLNMEPEMTDSNLKVEVQGSCILVAMRGTCLRAKYRRHESPWLATDGYGPDDPEATITFSEFRALAWAAANHKARQLGWISGYNELHAAIKLANPS